MLCNAFNKNIFFPFEEVCKYIFMHGNVDSFLDLRYWFFTVDIKKKLINNK